MVLVAWESGGTELRLGYRYWAWAIGYRSRGCKLGESGGTVLRIRYRYWAWATGYRSRGCNLGESGDTGLGHRWSAASQSEEPCATVIMEPAKAAWFRRVRKEFEPGFRIFCQAIYIPLHLVLTLTSHDTLKQTSAALRALHWVRINRASAPERL